MTYVTSAFSHTSCAVLAKVAPALTNGSHAEAVLFQTIKLCLPLLSKFKAIGTAMIPAPRKPIVFVV